MMPADAPHPVRQPLFDPYAIGRAIGALLRQMRAWLERGLSRAPEAPETAIAWEDGESDEREGR